MIAFVAPSGGDLPGAHVLSNHCLGETVMAAARRNLSKGRPAMFQEVNYPVEKFVVLCMSLACRRS